MKKILLILLLLIGAGISYVIFVGVPRKLTIAGEVVDCASSRAIEGARVVVGGTVRRLIVVPFPVWDFPVNAEMWTDTNGRFTVQLKVTGGPVQLDVHKDGYLGAQQWEPPGDDISIGLVAQAPTDRSTNYTTKCKRSSECLVTTTEIRRGKPVEVVQNVCN